MSWPSLCRRSSGPWGWPSATTSDSRNCSGPWWTGAPKSLWYSSAFSQVTGKDHWETLLRARAIENQVYILAPALSPHPDQSLKTYGRSLIIDPWGLILAQAPDREEIISARLDRRYLLQLRAELPCLSNRCL